jgi:hypothetical protein
MVIVTRELLNGPYGTLFGPWTRSLFTSVRGVINMSLVTFKMSQGTFAKICFIHHLDWFCKEIMDLVIPLLNSVHSNCYTQNSSRKLGSGDPLQDTCPTISSNLMFLRLLLIAMNLNRVVQPIFVVSGPL